MDWQEYHNRKAVKAIHHRNKGKSKCVVCGYYLCHCQLNLSDFGFEKIVTKKDNPIKNCQVDCVYIGTGKCVNCFNYNMYKGKRVEK